MAAFRVPRAALALCAGLAAALLASPAASAAVTEFPLPPQRSASHIAAGPDGALWFTSGGLSGARIGRITTGGTVTLFSVPASIRFPFGITRGPDGALWFYDGVAPRIGRISTAGAVRVFDVPAPGAQVGGLTAGPDGALWFTLGTRIGRLTTAGAFTLFPLPADSFAQGGITAGPDGALWFTESDANRIGRITTGGTVTEFPLPTPFAGPGDIVAGPDGALWFTERGANRIGRVTTAGSITEFPIRTPVSGARAITAGPDGALWFAEQSAGKVGRVTTAGVVSDFRVPSFPGDIAAGPDGALWFTLPATNRIGRITTDHPREDAVDGTLYTQAPCDPPQIGCTKPRYVIGVSSTPSGERPFGRVALVAGERQTIFVAAGAPTCLRVEGRRAAIGAEIRAEAPPDHSPPRAAIIVVEDNGPASADRFVVQDLPAGSAPTTCPSPAGFALGPGFPGSPGGSDPGVVVTDVPSGPPAPTSKDHCKDGGWAAFGFKNQGQCNAFVNRGPKPR